MMVIVYIQPLTSHSNLGWLIYLKIALHVCVFKCKKLYLFFSAQELFYIVPLPMIKMAKFNKLLHLFPGIPQFKGEVQ